MSISSYNEALAQIEQASSNPTLPIGTVRVLLTNAQVDPDENSQVIRAFLPTGSTSGKCLVTMNDTNNFAFGTVIFCGEREPSGLGSTPGVLVSIFFPSQVVPNFAMAVTVYQEGAKQYGQPVLCTGTTGC
jgi:hypothetical protein